MKISSDINNLFECRDKSVKSKDRTLFLSTQVGEIQGGGSSDYMALDDMDTVVLHEEAVSEIEKVVFVKETYKYTKNGKEPYSSYPVYFLVNTIKGWKIYRVR